MTPSPCLQSFSPRALPFPAGGSISVIIPVWKDHAALAGVLAVLRHAPEVAECIVSFAEPDPAALAETERRGARCLDAGPPNRGLQLDLGAAAASGDWLLFHHADSHLTPEHLRALAALSSETEVQGGAFYRQFDERHPWLRPFSFLERWHNRTFGALYGDQSLFVRRECFHALGGFRGLPLMEDVDFSLRLRAFGKIRLLDPPMASSPRKHLNQGPWRTTLKNAALLFLYHLGVHPARLHAWYYRHGAEGDACGQNSVAVPPRPAEPVPSPSGTDSANSLAFSPTIDA